VLNVISLGAGVQSSTMALMAAHGEITPMPDCAIFADTGAEPQKVYEHLNWLESVLPYRVHRVHRGNLRDEIYGWTRGENRIDARPPFFTEGGGMLRRQCTQDYKVMPLREKQRELIGLRKGQRGPDQVAAFVWIGISTDEATRMKPSRDRYFAMRWPLIEAGISRNDCLRWLAQNGYPKPPKSACTFCPYHDDAMWRDMRANDPESWADAVAVDAAIRRGDGQQWFVHRSLLPLDQVDLRTAEDAGQLSMFNEECEGMCGV
jgi:hypothetical protein